MTAVLDDDRGLVIVVALTPREQEVLRLLVRGLSAKEAALRLDVTPRNIESKIEKLRLKTRTRNRTHLVAHALKHGLVSLTA